MSQNNQINNERDRFLIVSPGTGRETVSEIGHAKQPRQLKQTRIPVRLRHGNFSAVDFGELIGANQAGIALDEIKTERQRQDRNHDHEPVAMFAKNFDHVTGRQFTSEPNRANFFL